MIDTLVKSWRTAAVAVAALAMAFGASSAEAAPIGAASFGVGGAFEPSAGSHLGNTNSIFIGNGGAILVTQGDIGDLGALVMFGGQGTMADIPSLSSFTPISGFLTLNSGVSVDLNSLTVNSQSGPTPGFINLSGNATIHAPGFDATEAVYSWSGTTSDNEGFAFAMQTSVPEPISVALLGLGLLAVAYGRRLTATRA